MYPCHVGQVLVVASRERDQVVESVIEEASVAGDDGKHTVRQSGGSTSSRNGVLGDNLELLLRVESAMRL